MEPYDPNIHGQILPFDEEDDLETLPDPLRNLRTPREASPETQVVEGFEPYDPEVHGEIIPMSEEEAIWSQLDAEQSDSLNRERQEYEASLTPDQFSQHLQDEAVADAPKPEASPFDRRNWPAIAADIAVGAVYEGPRRVISELERAQDWILKGVFGDKADLGAMREKVTGSREVGVPYEPAASETAVEIGATLAPSVLGGAGAFQAATAAPKILQLAAATLGASTGYTLSKTRGEDRIFIGDDALLSEWLGETIFEGLPETDVEGREKRLNTFLNDLTDAVAIAYPTERAADLVFRVGSAAHRAILKPAASLFKSDREAGLTEAIGRRLIEKLKLAQSANSPEERQRMIESAARTLEDNAEILFKLDDEDIRFLRDTMSALEEGTLDEGLRQRARSVRGGATASGQSDELATTLSAPSRTTRETLERRTDELGGTDAIDQAGKGVQDQAETVFKREFEDPIIQTERALETRSKDLTDVLENDDALRGAIRRLDDEVDIDVLGPRNQTVEKIRSSVRQAYDKMKEESDRLIAQIPEYHVMIDDSLSETISRLPKNMRDKFKIETDDKGSVLAISGDFKELYQTVVPKLSADINAGMKGGADVSGLRNLRDEITAQIDYIPEAEAFREFYKNKWAPVWKDGALEDFAGIYRGTVYRDPKIRPVDYAADTEKVLTNSMSNRHYAKHIHDLLATPEAGNRKELITDFALGDVAAKLQSEINAGKTLKEIDIASFTRTLEEYGSVLKEVDPEGYKRVNSFLGKLRSAKDDIKTLEKDIVDLTKRAKDGEKLIFDREYKEFFNTRVAPISGGQYKSFDKLMKDEDAIRRVGQILDRAQADGRQDIIDGMKAAYFRHLEDEFFVKDALPGGARKANLDKLEDAFLGKTDTFTVGREIFADNPETVDLLEGLLRETQRITQTLHNQPKMTIVNFDEFAKQSSTGIDKIITLTLGVLNRMAARARSLKGTAVEIMNPNEQAREIFDKIMSDPNHAAQVFKKIAASEGRGMAPETRRAFEDWLVFTIPNLGDDDVKYEAEVMEQKVFEDELDRESQELFR